MSDDVRIAVIGAGIAGLACAHELARGDASVTLFERSRGLGGRLATRHQGGYAFDHGAQFVTARNRAFAEFVKTAAHAGVLREWRPRLHEDGREWPEPIEDWYVGTPGMKALVRPLARGVDIRLNTSVHEMHCSERGWELLTDAGRIGTYHAVAVAVPAPQALTLLVPHSRTFRCLTEVRMGACWSGLFAFDEPLGLEAEAMRWTTGPLVWAACNSHKPDRASPPECWVVHASSSWSQEHLEADAGAIAAHLLHEFARAVGRDLPPPVHASAHRWRHAVVVRALGQPCLFDEEISAGACGDWCIAPRVEAAFDSGRALAQSLLSTVGATVRPSRA